MKHYHYYRFIAVNNICCCGDRAFLPEKYYREVTLDPDCKIYIGIDHFGADKLILGEKKEIKDMDIWKNEDFCIKAVKCNKYSIISIPNPSIDVQLLAVKQSGYLIQYLYEKNIPISEEVKLEAVKNYGLSIKYIKDPSENIQQHAVRENGLAIRYIENPSENIQMIAVTQKRKRTGDVLSYIMKKNINVSEEVKMAAVEKSAWSIIYINNPSEELQLDAVKKDGLIIKYIINPSEKIQLAAVEQNGSAILYIDHPSEKIQLAAVEQNGSTILYIDHPSEKIQLAAVKKDKYFIRHIKNPYDSVTAFVAFVEKKE